jgi:phospholipase A1/A2
MLTPRVSVCFIMKKIYVFVLLISVFISAFASAVAVNQPVTAVSARQKQENAVEGNPFGILLYKPTYVLPAYYTESPDQAVYENNTPDSQRLDHLEFKAQLSFKVPLWRNMLGTQDNLFLGYTQLSYWQFYAKSQYFRETDYEPEIFWVHHLTHFLDIDSGVVHQSNGRGGEYERSWNRVYVNLIYSRKHYMISIKPWALIFKDSSSDVHNPHIVDYMGNGRFLAAYKWNSQEVSVMSRNNLQSGFTRGAEELTYSFPLFGHVKGYLQAFSGYGQSLIEYDHYTNGVGVGIALNDWI